MSRAVLFCNGEIHDLDYHRRLLRDGDLIIAVDGGGRYCMEMGVVPDVALGDFDSLPRDILVSYEPGKTECISFPADKDYIDMALGIEEARKRGRKEILILGAFGGRRVDMFLGNLLALAAYDGGGEIVMKNEWSEARFLKGRSAVTLRGAAGDYVSLLPLSETVKTGHSEGLKYPLEGLSFYRGETRSISNELTGNEASLKLTEGEAILILQKR